MIENPMNKGTCLHDFDLNRPQFLAIGAPVQLFLEPHLGDNLKHTLHMVNICIVSTCIRSVP